MDLIDRQAAIDTLHMDTSIIPYKKAREYADATILEIRNRLEKLPSVQPEPIWGLPVSADRPLADVEIVSRLRDIQKQIPGGSYAIDRAIEIIEAVASAQPETAKRIVGKSRNGMTLWYQCDMCNEPVDAQDNFCRGCGRRLTDG